MLASLFRASTVVLTAAPELHDEALYPEERAHIQAAIPARRAEFATTRLLARRAFEAFGVMPCALVPSPNRAVVWPPEVVGSITHCPGYCAVVMARRADALSVGVDAERLRVVDDGVPRLVLSSREEAWVNELASAASRIERLLLVFSAKEAFYKCQFPLTSRLLGFKDVEVVVDFAAGRFEVTARVPLPSEVSRVQGRFVFEDGRVLTGIELRVPQQD